MAVVAVTMLLAWAHASEVAGRLALSYRFRVRSPGDTRKVEQHLYCDVTGRHIQAIDLCPQAFGQ
jgi:hypothetical protein